MGASHIYDFVSSSAPPPQLAGVFHFYLYELYSKFSRHCPKSLLSLSSKVIQRKIMMVFQKGESANTHPKFSNFGFVFLIFKVILIDNPSIN